MSCLLFKDELDRGQPLLDILMSLLTHTREQKAEDNERGLDCLVDRRGIVTQLKWILVFVKEDGIEPFIASP